MAKEESLAVKAVKEGGGGVIKNIYSGCGGDGGSCGGGSGEMLIEVPTGS